MLIHEAAVIQGLIDKVVPSKILDCGSGTRADRTIIQPHIAAVFAGYDVVWTDFRSSLGVLECDFTKPETLALLPRCDLVTCCSLLEHVTNIEGALLAVVSLVDKWLILSVPLNYPIHNCPIDNGWRPTPQRLKEELEVLGMDVVESVISGPENFGGVESATASIVLAKKRETAATLT